MAPTPAPTFWQVLGRRVERGGGDPLVTFYDEATGERVELSATTYANWVAKTASLLQDELDLDPGRPRGRRPAHPLARPGLAGGGVGTGRGRDRRHRRGDARRGGRVVVSGPDTLAPHARLASGHVRGLLAAPDGRTLRHPSPGAGRRLRRGGVVPAGRPARPGPGHGRGPGLARRRGCVDARPTWSPSRARRRVPLSHRVADHAPGLGCCSPRCARGTARCGCAPIRPLPRRATGSRSWPAPSGPHR